MRVLRLHAGRVRRAALTPAEMLGQIVCANGVLAPQGQKVGNIVLMGSGEPLDNYDNVVQIPAHSADGGRAVHRHAQRVALDLRPGVKTCGGLRRRICR